MPQSTILLRRFWSNRNLRTMVALGDRLTYTEELWKRLAILMTLEIEGAMDLSESRYHKTVFVGLGNQGRSDQGHGHGNQDPRFAFP